MSCLLFAQGLNLSTCRGHLLSQHVVCEDVLCPPKSLDFMHSQGGGKCIRTSSLRGQTSECGSLVRINSCVQHYNALAIINTMYSSPGMTSSGMTHIYSYHQRGPTPASYMEQNPIKIF